jgi:prepilin-type N-terminal cleavage/methylation domain-containing protein
LRHLRWQRMWADQSGFTLIELLAVAVMILVLSLMALPVYARITGQGREARSREELAIIERALEAHHAEHGYYPNRLGVLVESGYMKPTAFTSPWSSDERPVYYFYAVDDPRPGMTQAYVLGDPGPQAERGCAWEHSTTLNPDPDVPLPCGRFPFYAQESGETYHTSMAPQPDFLPVLAWSFGYGGQKAGGLMGELNHSCSKAEDHRKSLAGCRPDLLAEH